MLLASAQAHAQDSRTFSATATIRADQPGPKLSRYLYGQFAEHLGHGIYDGVWVGEDSAIANTRGYRNDVVAALKKLRVPVVRWPGGCFADEYHWRDGIGPRDQRPVRINTHWGGVQENNAFGTHEFMDFAELIGADAYVAGNVGSGSPQEMAEWVEYITSDSSSTLAQLRRKNGRDKPWRLPYFGVGNETWGCGGNMRPEFFADLYRQFATFIKAPRDNRPIEVASGANVDDYRWTEVMLSQAVKHMDAYSVHYYTFPGRWENKGPSVGFAEAQWASTLQHALRMDELITKHAAIMDKYDPDKRVGLYVDEWGTWYDPEPGRNPGFLYQQNTLRDALVAALTLNVFHRHAERVRMANIAQMVNVLQAMILTDKEKMVADADVSRLRDVRPVPGDATAACANRSAANIDTASGHCPQPTFPRPVTAEGRLHVALVNADPHRRASIAVRVTGANPRSASGRILTASAMDARNTFERPNAVQPAPFTAGRKGDALLFELPPMSVVVTTLAT